MCTMIQKNIFYILNIVLKIFNKINVIALESKK
jgi:hypothetical protein